MISVVVPAIVTNHGGTEDLRGSSTANGVSLQQPRVERQRQQGAELMMAGLPPQVGEDDVEVAAELPEDLAAGTAGRRGRGGIRDDGDAAKGAMSVREGLEHRHALRADRQAVGGVLDVAAGD